MSPAHDRLAIFLPDLVVGGAERSMLRLAGGIAERGYAVDLVLANARGPLLNEVPPTVRLIDLKARRMLTSLPALTRYLRKTKPSAVLSVMYANFIAVWGCQLAQVSTRLVVSERTTLTSAAGFTSSGLRNKLMPVLARMFYPKANNIVAVSHGVADDLTQAVHIPSDKIRVIYNPVITPDLKEKMDAPLDHSWFSPDQNPVILSVGRLSAAKNYDVLIRAFDKVRQSIPARLLILGDGEDRAALEALVKQLGLERVVSLPGFALNPYPYMKNANVFVLSSRWEGLPGVLIEALFCGAPLVSTDCPSGAREILADGKYGHLVPVGDVDELAQAITASLKEKRTCPGEESWSQYELQHVVDQYIEVLFG